MNKFALYFTLALFTACSSSSEETLLSGNAITNFQLTINGQPVTGQINESDNTIVFNVSDADISVLTPAIKISEGASISPSPGTPRNFNQEVVYTVTAEDGSTRSYTIVVNNTISSSENSISRFGLPLGEEVFEGVIDHENNMITFEVVGADLTSLVPEIEIPEGATISPSGTQDFSSEVVYTVKAENGDERAYTIVVNNRPLNTESKILSFTVGINGESIEGRIDEETKQIAFETGSFTISRLLPEITLSSHATVVPASGEPVDFTGPVTYTVTAENGESTTYNIVINQAYKIGAYTSYGPNPDTKKVYSRAKLYITTEFLDPRLPGFQLYLSDGTNRSDLAIEDVSAGENNRILYYTINTKIPENTITSPNYKIYYEQDDLVVESEVRIDVLAEDAPVITGINQQSYSPGDTLIVSGENLPPLIAVPSNGSLYMFNPLGNIDTSLNEDQTEYRLSLENWSSFTYSAFFQYSGDTREVIFIGAGGRVAEQVTVNVNR